MAMALLVEEKDTLMCLQGMQVDQEIVQGNRWVSRVPMQLPTG
jgi:hypothetical protein